MKYDIKIFQTYKTYWSRVAGKSQSLSDCEISYILLQAKDR